MRWTAQDLADYESRRAESRVMQNRPLNSTARVPSRAAKPATDNRESPPSKYRNKKTEVDGILFHSKREAARYQDLKTLERAGAIRDLRLQVPFIFELNDVRICKYFADFVYRENGREIVEDSKGKRTKDYMIKRKLMKAFFAIEILET